jgi:multidrug efflux pump subunit AcrB
VTVKAPEGTNLGASNELVKTIEKKLSPYEDNQYVIATVGAGGSMGQESGGSHMSRVSMDFVDARVRNQKSSRSLQEARDTFRSIVGAEVTIKEEEHGPPTGPPVNLEISGDDFETLGAIAREVMGRIRDVRGIVDLKDDYVLGKPEIRVEIDKEKASLLGLDTFTIANTVKAAVNGIKAGVYRVLDEEIDIIARLPEKDRRSISDIERLTISDSEGRPIPLTSVAEVFVSSGLGSINRIDQKRVVTVQSEVTGRLANDVLTEVKHRLAGLHLPRGYTISYTGQQEEQEKSKVFLSKAFLAAIFLISLVLITQFNSITLPLIIMTSVLLSLIGVFWGLLVTGLPFGILMTGIGVISLAGVVVNNAIVLIDYVGQLRSRGLAVMEALLQACTVRFRPVMLTAITTILGLIPMATGVSFDFTRLRWDIGGESSQWWGPMAVAVIFGLAVATVLTLGVVPTLYSLIESFRARFKRFSPDVLLS